MKLLFGVPDGDIKIVDIPIHSKYKIRMRCDDFATIFIKESNSVSHNYIEAIQIGENNTIYYVGPAIGVNQGEVI